MYHCALMPLAAGARIGPYEILSPLGAGGMGEVYKARDTRLDRAVAIKLIHPRAAADPEFRERFEREAKAISALDHPNICALYDVGHDPRGGVEYLVMQYLEGETLADRLARAGQAKSDPSRPLSASSAAKFSTAARAPLPLETTVEYAAEIAHALDAAHRRGIVHRDLKPGNVMLTKSGTKLLDFGLAKLVGGQPVPAGLAGDATKTSPFQLRQGSPLTGQGALLGTLYYMSPEQLEGRDVDARSDIFSFGAVLHEMLSGRRTFERDSQAGVIAAIIKDAAPPLGDLADARTPSSMVARRALERLVQKCLAKNPDDRWQSAADLADELTWINEERLRSVEEQAGALAAGPVSRTRERAWMAAALLGVAGLVALGWLWYPRPASPAAAVTFTIGPPEGETFSNGPGLLNVSTDGRRIAFVTGEGDARRIWIRPFASLVAQPLESSNGAFQPFWSPDDRFIIFAGGAPNTSLLKIDTSGGPPMTLAPDAGGRVAWSKTGVILFTTRGDRLFRIPEAGGQPTLVFDLEKAADTDIFWPLFLPDGRRFIFCARSREPSKSSLFLASLDAAERTPLVDVLSNVDYAKGHLFYHREGTLMAHPFDEATGRLTGDAVPIVEGVQFNQSNGRGAFSVSPAGVLAYRSAISANASRTLGWFDPSGKLLGKIGPTRTYIDAEISPDGRRVVVSELNDDSSRSTLSLLDVERGILTRFTVGETDESNPVWWPDGQSILFSSVRKQRRGLYRRGAGGGATRDELLYESSQTTHPLSISSDGRFLLFVRGAGSASRIWALPTTGDRKPFEVFRGSATRDTSAMFSPDGKWIAYVSYETANNPDVYVQPFPADGRRIRISTSGGHRPRWTGDGKRIIYRSPDDALMSVNLTMAGDTLRPDSPQLLFRQRRASPLLSAFAMEPRGDRFLLILPPEQEPEARQSPITVVLNVEALLKTK